MGCELSVRRKAALEVETPDPFYRYGSVWLESVAKAPKVKAVVDTRPAAATESDVSPWLMVCTVRPQQRWLDVDGEKLPAFEDQACSMSVWRMGRLLGGELFADDVHSVRVQRKWRGQTWDVVSRHPKLIQAVVEGDNGAVRAWAADTDVTMAGSTATAAELDLPKFYPPRECLPAWVLATSQDINTSLRVWVRFHACVVAVDVVTSKQYTGALPKRVAPAGDGLFSVLSRAAVPADVVAAMVTPEALVAELQRHFMSQQPDNNRCFMCAGTGLRRACHSKRSLGQQASHSHSHSHHDHSGAGGPAGAGHDRSRPRGNTAGSAVTVASAASAEATPAHTAEATPSCNSSRLLADEHEECWLCHGTGALTHLASVVDGGEGRAASPSDAEEASAGSVDGGSVDTSSEDNEDDGRMCGMCWSEPGTFGLSSGCSHYYCADCIKLFLQDQVAKGVSVMKCPMCVEARESAARDGAEEAKGAVDESDSKDGAEEAKGAVDGVEEAKGAVDGAEEAKGAVDGAEEAKGAVDGAEEAKGAVDESDSKNGAEESNSTETTEEAAEGVVDEKALAFLAHRGIIDGALWWRALRQQRTALRQYFPCPNKGCNAVLQQPAVTPMKMVAQGQTVEMDGDNPKCVALMCPSCADHVCVDCFMPTPPDGRHQCSAHKVFQDRMAMEATMNTLAKGRDAKRCPRCSMFVFKNGGCNAMMCGTKAHGSIRDAVRNGGCGCLFRWDTLRIYKAHFRDFNGNQVTGQPPEMFRNEIIALRKELGFPPAVWEK